MSGLDWAHATERDVSKYRVNGKRVPSVTEILSIEGFVVFPRVPARLLEAAANRGRLAHAVTAKMDLGDFVGSYPPEAEPYVKAYEKFRADSNFHPELVEHVIVNPRHRYAGTLDRVGLLNGRRVLIDLKCTAQCQKSVGMQLSAYELSLEEPVEARFTLRLLSDGNYRLDEKKDRRDVHDFLAATRCVHRKLDDGLITL